MSPMSSTSPENPSFFESIFCQRYITSQQNLLQLLQQSSTNYDNLKKDYSSLIQGDCPKNLATLQTSYDSLKALADSQQQMIQSLKDNDGNDLAPLPAATQTLALQYWQKYPPAAILYPGRDLPNAPAVAAEPQQNYDMHVENWASYGINCPEANVIIQENGFDVLTIMNKEGVPFHRACDLAMSRIKVWVTKAGYQYSFDQSTTADSEYWKFFIETLNSLLLKIGSDCEDWAILCYVLWRTAGVPKHLLRIVAGITRDSQGHCTNHALLSDLKWHHINSTTPYGLDNFDVLTTPLINDATDQIGLASIWFSFTESAAWSGGVPLLSGVAGEPKMMYQVRSGEMPSVKKISLEKCKLLRRFKIRRAFSDHAILKDSAEKL